MKLSELESKILGILPYAQFEENDYGEIIIYTDMMMTAVSIQNDDRELVPFKNEEEK